MSFLAYKQYSTTAFGGNVSAPINGPISHRTPLQMGPHNLGVLSGIRPNPPQFYPADGASQFVNARHQYLRTASYDKATKTGTEVSSNIRPTSVYVAGTQRSYLVSQSTKYLAPQSSSLYISTRKAQAVGKSSYKQGLSTESPLSYKNYNVNNVKSALRSVRGGGCVAPAKKGSIYNTSLTTGHVSPWGANVRSTY